MKPVKTSREVEDAARGAIKTLYGSEIQDFRIRVLLPFPSEQNREAWDANVTFLLDGEQYTVDLLINEKDGRVTNARLIDTMTPL